MLLLITALFPYDEVIMEIGVRGVKNIDTVLVITVSGLKIGDILTKDIGDKCIKNLYSTELFRYIRLEALRSEYGGVKVIIVVDEFPKVKEIEITGNKKVKKKDLENLIDVTLPKILSDRKLFEITNKIKEVYKNKGYRGMIVKIQRENIDNYEKITFVIEEGKKLTIKDVVFEGNEKLPDNKLRKKLKTKGRKNWWSFWIKGEIVDSLIEQDFNNIVDYYKENGFLEAKVDSFKIEEINNNSAIIKFFVYEGKRYYLGNLSFSGNSFLENPMKFFKIKSRDIFNNKKFEKSLQELYSYYTDNGYLYVNVNPITNFRGDTVDVEIKINENNKVYVKFIDIIGNISTYDKVIRRYITIYPGDAFSREKIITSQQNLFRLGYFENLLFNIRKESSLDSVSLVFEVKEKQTGQVSAGMGFSKDVGITGNVSINIPNFLGRGQTVNFTYERTVGQTGSRPIQYISLGFQEPWLFDTPTSVGISAFSTYRLWEYFTEYRTGFQIDIGRILGQRKDITVSGSYRLSRNRIDCDTTKVPDYIKEQYGIRWESSVSTNLLKDSRDNYFYAKSGTYISISPKFAGTILGGDVHYYRLNLEIKRFVEIYKDFVLMSRVFFGHLKGLKGSPTPIIERYQLGGSGYFGIRGYVDNSIRLSRGYGGNDAVILNLELRRNITNMIYLLAFVDAGNTFEDLNKFDLTDLYTGAGFGFRIEIPMMGIFGLDLGYGFDKNKGGKWETHFQLGQSF